MTATPAKQQVVSLSRQQVSRKWLHGCRLTAERRQVLFCCFCARRASSLGLCGFSLCCFLCSGGQLQPIYQSVCLYQKSSKVILVV